jgi:excisionase family DNA binding protein
MHEKLYNVKELHKILRASQKLIKELLRKDELKGFKVGREWRVTQTELNKFMRVEESNEANND